MPCQGVAKTLHEKSLQSIYSPGANPPVSCWRFIQSQLRTLQFAQTISNHSSHNTIFPNKKNIPTMFNSVKTQTPAFFHWAPPSYVRRSALRIPTASFYSYVINQLSNVSTHFLSIKRPRSSKMNSKLDVYGLRFYICRIHHCAQLTILLLLQSQAPLLSEACQDDNEIVKNFG